MSITDTLDDARLLQILGSVSREIDLYCNRRFYAESRTRLYTAEHRDCLRVDDLLSVTALTTDEDGDRVYETTWAATDYDLEPANAALESPPRPYREIVVAPDGNETFPRGARAVQIAGAWGYYDQRETSTATVAEAVDSSETDIDVSSGAALSAGLTILIDSEQMYIRSISFNTITVTRAVNGTTAATHSNGASIQVYIYPVITEACLYQTALNFLAGSGATGQAGAGDFAQPIRAGGLHPFTRQMLDHLRLAVYA